MFETGERIDGRYQVRERLGEGGMGTVFSAWDEILRRPTALKTTSPGRNDARLRARLFGEAAALASLRAPNVAAVYTAGHARPDVPYVAMELVRGQDLASVIAEHAARGAVVPLGRACSILAGLARGLAAVHGAGLVHRDVKPDNVIIEGGTGRVVLVDFGLALEHDATVEAAVIFGTPGYIAPEICTAPIARPHPSADVYAFGCLAYELLSGDLPFHAPTIPELLDLHVLAPRPDLAERRPEVSVVGLNELVRRCLSVDPRARPSSCAALAQELSERADALHAAALRVGVPERVRDEPATEQIRLDELEEYAALRVLVVDDDPVSARMAARCAQLALANIPIEVSKRSTSAGALESALKRAPDLILLDYLLPDENGLELLSQLRHRELASHAHVIVVSGTMELVDKWRFGVLGVEDFVEKPLGVANLVPLIDDVAGRRGWRARAVEP